LAPKGSFSGGEQRVLASVPAKKVRGAHVRGVVLAISPDFMEKKTSGLVDANMKIKSQAALFLSRGCDKRA
jgi:hypothetical protein